MMENARAAGVAGDSAGALTDNAGCVANAADRSMRDSGMTAIIGTGMYLQRCLGKSTPTPGFCNDVPAASDFTKSAAWTLARCQPTTLKSQACQLIASQVQAFCHPRAKTLAS